MDPWMIVYIVAAALILPSFLISIYCQINVTSTFDRYSKVLSGMRITASELAQKLLEMENIKDVEVVKINGKLTDCYVPRYKVIKLSESTYNSYSISALGVCAHEVGHAIQHHKRNFLFRLRTALVPVINFMNGLIVPVVLVGSILGFAFSFTSVGIAIVWASVALYGLILIFYLITLPLEHDASKRALELMKKSGCFEDNEILICKKVLKAAILTYISALSTTLLYFLRFLSYAFLYSKTRE